jgi:type VI secretion system protein ImpG
VDLKFDPSIPSAETLLVVVTCTNRDLPSLLPFGGEQGDFQVEGGSAVSRIRCLRKPTATLRPAQRRGAMWRLISHLSLNHLSIVEGGREALLEILSLYNFAGSLATRKQISGITSVASEPVMAKVGPLNRSAFVRGTLVRLEFDEEEFVGTGVFLMAAVLERFLALYSAINSFTQLEVTTRQREKVFAAWPPRAGNAILA